MRMHRSPSRRHPHLSIVNSEVEPVGQAEMDQIEREVLLELIDLHERAINRLPAASELRSSLERALPYLRIAAAPPPELLARERRPRLV